MKRFLFVSLLFLFLSPIVTFAQDNTKFRSTDYPLPRFVSVGQDKSYVRTGPGSRYPIKWVFKKKYLPVEVILEFDNWRKIIDHEGEVGWMHISQLSGRRSVLITATENAALHRGASKSEPLVAFLEPSVVANIQSCSRTWCLIEASGYKGWIEKEKIWGVYDDEIIKR